MFVLELAGTGSNRLACFVVQAKSEGNETVRSILEKDHKEQKVCERVCDCHSMVVAQYVWFVFFACLLQRVFDALFSEEEHKRLLKSGDVRLSYKAMQGALMIFLYRCAHSITTVPTVRRHSRQSLSVVV